MSDRGCAAGRQVTGGFYNMVKIECYIPEEYVARLREALNAVGALTVDGVYDSCMAVSSVRGSWRPLAGAQPYLGRVGELCEAPEAKVEFACRDALYPTAAEVIRRVHPYEKPVIHIIPLLNRE